MAGVWPLHRAQRLDIEKEAEAGSVGSGARAMAVLMRPLAPDGIIIRQKFGRDALFDLLGQVQDHVLIRLRVVPATFGVRHLEPLSGSDDPAVMLQRQGSSDQR